MKVHLFVGLARANQELGLVKIEAIIAKNHKSFKIGQPVVGYWDGEKELTARVVVDDQWEKILSTINQLKDELQQEEVAFIIESDTKIF